MSGAARKEGIRAQLNGHVPAVSASVLISMMGMIAAVWALPFALAKDVDKIENRLAHHTEQPMHRGSIESVADIKARMKAIEREQQETRDEVKAIRRDIGQGFESIIRKLDEGARP